MRSLVAAILLLSGAPVSADVGQWEPEIAEASARFAVPEEWIRRVMQAESGGRTLFNGRPVTSRAGAMGLMQIMPGTWADLRARLGLGSNPFHPRDNILAGTAYLRMMHDRFGYPGLFAAYNVGPKRYADYLAGAARLPRETIDYLAKTTKASGPPQRLAAALPSGRRPRPVEGRGLSDARGARPAAHPMLVSIAAPAATLFAIDRRAPR